MTNITSETLVVTQCFNTSCEKLFKLWTDPELLKQWFSPAGVVMTQCRMDLRPEGECHYCMQLPNGYEMWGKWLFKEIVSPEKLVTITAFSDAQGNLTRHPMSATWPLKTIATTTFTEQGDKTLLTISCLPHEANDEEILTFNSALSAMQLGWAGTLVQLSILVDSQSQ